MRLQVSQQRRLRAKRLRAHGAEKAAAVRQAVLRSVGIPLFGGLEHLVAPAAGEALFVQVRLLVIGQAGQMVERPVALDAPINGARSVQPLVRQKLVFAFEHRAALEAGVGPDRMGLQGAGFLFSLNLHSAGC